MNGMDLVSDIRYLKSDFWLPRESAFLYFCSISKVASYILKIHQHTINSRNNEMFRTLENFRVSYLSLSKTAGWLFLKNGLQYIQFPKGFLVQLALSSLLLTAFFCYGKKVCNISFENSFSSISNFVSTFCECFHFLPSKKKYIKNRIIVGAYFFRQKKIKYQSEFFFFEKNCNNSRCQKQNGIYKGNEAMSINGLRLKNIKLCPALQ